jgi:hypothetical protein
MHRASGAALGTPAMARRSGAWKHVAFDEAAGGNEPGTSSPGGESNPVNPRAGSATESVRGRVTTSLPVDNTGNKERCSEGSRSRAHRSDQAGLPGDRGPSITRAEAGSSPSSEAPLDHALAKVSTGRAAWKLPPRRKRRGAVIRGPADPESARVVSRLQTLGRRIFPGGVTRAERSVEPARVSLTRRSPGDDGGRFAVGEKGAGQARANVKGSACEPAAIARSEIEPAEGVLVPGSSWC